MATVPPALPPALPIPEAVSDKFNETLESLKADDLREGTNVLAAGGASVAALALAATAGAVTGTLEQIPFFKFFEESIGIAVSAYYANRLGGNFLTATGRERFRLELIENFTRVTGKAALAGKLARTDPELDAQIRGLIGNLEDLPEGGAELPENVREAVAAFIRNREGASEEETSALRASNAAMRDQMDTIEMLQTELEKARRETTYARANIKVLNMAGKEKRRLEAARDEARAEAAAVAEALRAEMADMAKSQAERKAELETKLEEERASSAKAREALERLSDGAGHDARTREDDRRRELEVAVAAAEKAAAELKAEFETMLEAERAESAKAREALERASNDAVDDDERRRELEAAVAAAEKAAAEENAREMARLRKQLEEANETARNGAEAEELAAALREIDQLRDALDEARATRDAEASEARKANEDELARLRARLAKARMWSDDVVKGLSANERKEVLAEMSRNVQDAKDLVLEERRKGESALEAFKAEATRTTVELLRERDAEAKTELAAVEARFAEDLAAAEAREAADRAAKLAAATAEAAKASEADLARHRAADRLAADLERAKPPSPPPRRRRNAASATPSRRRRRTRRRREGDATRGARRARCHDPRRPPSATGRQAETRPTRWNVPWRAPSRRSRRRPDVRTRRSPRSTRSAARAMRARPRRRRTADALGRARESERALAEMENAAKEADDARRDAAEARQAREKAEAEIEALEMAAEEARRALEEARGSSTEAEAARREAIDAAVRDAKRAADEAVSAVRRELERTKSDAAAKISELDAQLDVLRAEDEMTAERRLELQLDIADLENDKRVQDAIAAARQDIEVIRSASEKELAAAVAAAKTEAKATLDAAVAKAKAEAEASEAEAVAPRRGEGAGGGRGERGGGCGSRRGIDARRRRTSTRRRHAGTRASPRRGGEGRGATRRGGGCERRATRRGGARSRELRRRELGKDEGFRGGARNAPGGDGVPTRGGG